MKTTYIIAALFLSLLLFNCFGSKPMVQLGDCPLTITVQSDDKNFDGFANVYINRKFIGTTDQNTRALRVSLKKGEYQIIVMAEGHEAWSSTVLLLGDRYKQNVLAKLKLKETEVLEGM